MEEKRLLSFPGAAGPGFPFLPSWVAPMWWVQMENLPEAAFGLTIAPQVQQKLSGWFNRTQSTETRFNYSTEPEGVSKMLLQVPKWNQHSPILGVCLPPNFDPPNKLWPPPQCFQGFLWQTWAVSTSSRWLRENSGKQHPGSICLNSKQELTDVFRQKNKRKI